MVTSSDLRTGRHCVFVMHEHLVFVTKYRRRVFTRQILSEMQRIFAEVYQDYQDFDAEMIEFEGEHDHVHLLVNYPPKVAIARLVNSVVYLRANNMSQVELAKKLGIEPARLNEIVKYRVELFTLDRLIGYVEKLNPDVEVTVA